ncbi:MAG TPA: HemK2/MTQ2 family protein methyltransferase [Bacteroidia bacterium]
MRKWLKYIAARTWKPFLEKRLSRTNEYSHNGIKLSIPPGIFHPHYFYSTRFLLEHLLRENLRNKTFLELGCGSGLISLAVSKKGARVTASDINPTAVKALKENSGKNGLELNIIHSDLFTNIPPQTFDLIAINPPYYRGKTVNEKDLAWYCGEHHEFFIGLFKSIKDFMHPSTKVFIILSDDCDMPAIKDIAAKNSVTLRESASKRFLLSTERIFIIC